MNHEIGLSVVVPVYNEEKSILSTIESILRIADELDVDHELIIVNDGSTDQTCRILREHRSRYTLIEHAKNEGYGAAIKTGIRNSRYSIVAITDADGTYPNDMIPDLLREMRGHDWDMVVGSRTGQNVKMPVIRKPAKWFLNKLANYLSEYKIPDLNSGLRLFKKDEVSDFIKILPDGFSFTTTITMAMLTNKKKVKFVPIDYAVREGRSKIRPIRDTLNFIQIIIRTVMYFNPLKVFLPFSLLLFLAGLMVFLYSAFFLPKILETTVVVLFMTAVQILAIGMIADLIDKRNP